MKSFALSTAALLSALPLLASAQTPAPPPTAAQKAALVRNALTNVDKINVLEDSDFVFDFTNPDLKKTTGAGGTLISANLGNFAALALGDTLALTVGFMQPCGMNSPHTHPRANEILLVLPSIPEPVAANKTRRSYDDEPTYLTSAFIQENGSRIVATNLTTYSAMLFPKGSIHFQANFGCKPIQFVAALSDPDPGTLQVAQRYFALDPSVVSASLGGGLKAEDIEHLAMAIPDNMIAGLQECYDRCGIQRPDPQPTKQQQPKPTSTGSAALPPPSETQAPAGKVIPVIVGKDGGLTYTPNTIVAEVGDIVSFQFVTKNHTVTRSSFDMPCEPTADGAFDSGFMPIPQGSMDFKTFNVTVTDDKPIWFYCQQKPANAKSHCASGMNGVINAPASGPNTLEAFQAKAAQSP